MTTPTGIAVQPIRFTAEDAHNAFDTWGANCGPGAAAAILGMTLDNLRPHLGDFERKGYTNPTLMWSILNNVRATFIQKKPHEWPDYGLCRVQWCGRWTKPGVPARAAYRHTHWVGARTCHGNVEIFDINCMSVGGWVTKDEWETQVVPWLVKECVPGGDGAWFLTHSVEVVPNG